MEIVKRLEGSAPEEEDFNFNEENQKKLKNKRVANKAPKKSNSLAFLGIATLIGVGYFGFSTFNKDEANKFDNSLVVTDTGSEKNPKETLTTEVDNIITPSKESESDEKVSVYTEELAQVIIAAPIPIKKEETVNKSEVLKTLPVTTMPTQEEQLIQAVSHAKKELTRQETLPPLIKAKPVIEKKRITEKKTTKPVVKKVVVAKKKVVPKKKKVVKRKQRAITIKKGDTLASIAHHYYGNAMEFKGIIRANRDIKNAKSRLKVGKKLIVPYLPKHKRRRFVIVRSGYSLAYISKKFYGTTGKIQMIVDANSDIKNKKSTLRIGQKVYVPRLK